MASFYPKAHSSRLGTAQNVSTSTTTAASSALGTETYQVLLVADVATRIRIGDGTPSAVTTDTLLPANVPMFFICTPGQKVAAILGTGTGNLSITELS
jgi:hypothetical protein